MFPINSDEFTYFNYLKYVNSLVQNHKTSGHNQTEKLIEYTALNQKRMERLNKTIKLIPDLVKILKNLNQQQTWVIISEAWCGDCAQNIPVIGKMAEAANNKIKLKIIGRDENPNWMEKYTTNGAASIPKLIAFNTNNIEIFTWGPRPKPALEILEYYKANKHTMTKDEFELQLHTWYAKNKQMAIQQEFIELLETASLNV